MEYTWDSAKAEDNRRKHGIRFSVAVRVFADPFVQLRQDRVDDAGEQRWHALGFAGDDLLLLVVHTVTGEMEQAVRLISARKAKRHEREEYENGHFH